MNHVCACSHYKLQFQRFIIHFCKVKGVLCKSGLPSMLLFEKLKPYAKFINYLKVLCC